MDLCGKQKYLYLSFIYLYVCLLHSEILYLFIYNVCKNQHEHILCLFALNFV